MTDKNPLDPLEQLRSELSSWRTRLDELRLQAGLGRMELADRLEDFGKRLEPARQEAQERLASLVDSGVTEARHAASSVLAGFEELLRTHRDLTRRAAQERAERAQREHDAHRHDG